ncbi:MAG: DUF362 domain-containing protein, partial [Candidatus Omnitrophota bacterium]|nr:DUF362 domain-containing protein [Candidatus Omnitrophota bacterium]
MGIIKALTTPVAKRTGDKLIEEEGFRHLSKTYQDIIKRHEVITSHWLGLPALYFGSLDLGFINLGSYNDILSRSRKRPEPGKMEGDKKFVMSLTKSKMDIPVYVAEGRNRVDNIRICVEKYLEDKPESFKDKTIFLNPNIVDSTYPDACTNPDTLNAVVGLLLAAGAKKIYIGDSPSMMGLENMQKLYDGRLNQGEALLGHAMRELGYNLDDEQVEVLDPNSLPVVPVNGIG